MSAPSTIEADALARLSDQLNDLAEEFTGWFSQTGQAAVEQSGELFEQVQRPLLVGLGLMQHLNDAHHLGWRPIQLAQALDQLNGSDGSRTVAGALLLYTRFLGETGRWTTEKSDLGFSLRLLEAELVNHDESPAVLDDGEEIESMLEIGAVAEVETLVEWIGAGRPVTGTGGLRLADVPEISELLGEPVATSKAKATEDELVVRSMWEAPTLSLAWVSAERAGLIEVRSRKVHVTELGRVLLTADDGHDPRALDLVRQVVSSYVVSMLEATPADAGSIATPDGATAADDVDAIRMVVLALARSITGEPVRYDAMLNAAGAAADELRDEVEYELSSWEAAGLVEIGDVVEVPAAARLGVAAGLLTWGVAPEDLAGAAT